MRARWPVKHTCWRAAKNPLQPNLLYQTKVVKSGLRADLGVDLILAAVVSHSPGDLGAGHATINQVLQLLPPDASPRPAKHGLSVTHKARMQGVQEGLHHTRTHSAEPC